MTAKRPVKLTPWLNFRYGDLLSNSIEIVDNVGANCLYLGETQIELTKAIDVAPNTKSLGSIKTKFMSVPYFILLNSLSETAMHAMFRNLWFVKSMGSGSQRKIFDMDFGHKSQSVLRWCLSKFETKCTYVHKTWILCLDSI